MGAGDLGLVDLFNIFLGDRMDLTKWTTVEPSGMIHPYEFERPEHMGPRLVTALGITRMATGRYMRLTKSKSGRYFHPEGDAVSPDSTSHAARSLHKYDLEDTLAGALAQDFDFGTANPDYLVELFFRVQAVRFEFAPYRWTGIGIYPHWKLGDRPNPGFHVDLRPMDHATLKDRVRIQTWIRTESGSYVPFSWAGWKQESDMRRLV